uniref:BAR domain-containing protein n=2 Tax=Panagrellus redivivus TaxID=6233 RepID=A0A7E4UWR1_PANRE
MNRRSAGHERTLLVDHPNITQRRRTTSSSKLAQLFSRESETDKISNLLDGINNMSVTSRMTTKAAETQRKGAEQLAKWAHSSRNTAIDDVMQKTNTLFEMFADQQTQFARNYDHFLHQLKKIAETERQVRECEFQTRELREKEKKLRKSLDSKNSRIFGRPKGTYKEISKLEEALEKTKFDREMAERRLAQTRSEAEVVKMFRFRHGMMGIADSYRNYAKNCQDIFTCHREICEMVPAVCTQDVNHMMYDGMPITRDRVENLRRSMGNEFAGSFETPVSSGSRRRSDPSRSRHHNQFRDVMGTPPPPYSATAPNLSDEENLITPIRPRRVAVPPPTTTTVSPMTRLAASPSTPGSSGFGSGPSSAESTPSSSSSAAVGGRLYPSLSFSSPEP